MKTKKFFMMALAALMVAATPCSPLLAEEAQDSTKNAGTAGVTTGMTVNGKPATPAQKEFNAYFREKAFALAVKYDVDFIFTYVCAFEMQEERVILVVPRPFIATYPRERQDRIWTLGQFVRFAREVEGL